MADTNGKARNLVRDSNEVDPPSMRNVTNRHSSRREALNGEVPTGSTQSVALSVALLGPVETNTIYFHRVSDDVVITFTGDLDTRIVEGNRLSWFTSGQ
jgi:hypothetical protein